MITPSGGVGIVLADAAAAQGLDLPEMPRAAQAKVRALVPFAGPRNPVDTTAQILNDFSIFSRTLDIMVEDGGYDVLIAFLAHIGRNPEHMAKLKDALIAVRARNPRSLFALCLLTHQALREELNNAGFPAFEDPGRTVRALAALRRFAQGFDTAATTPVTVTSMPGFEPKQLNQAQTKQLMAAAGIPVVPERLARSREAALAAATALGFPIAIKIVSPDIAHKTDVGGVALDLAVGRGGGRGLRRDAGTSGKGNAERPDRWAPDLAHDIRRRGDHPGCSPRSSVWSRGDVWARRHFR